MRSLRQLDRVVRRAVKAEVREAGDKLDDETRAAIKDLAKDFRTGLRDAFLGAGRGHEFDSVALLTGVSEAIAKLAEGLRALRGDEPDETPEVVEPPVDSPIETPIDAPVKPGPAEIVDGDGSLSGGLVETSA